MANRKLIVLPDTSTLSMGSCAELTWLRNQEPCGLKQIDCLHAISDGMMCRLSLTWILIRTYKLRTSNKYLPPLRISVCRNPWHPFAEPCTSRYIAMPRIIGIVLVKELCSACDISFIFVVVRVVKSLCSYASPLLTVCDCNLIIIYVLHTSYNDVFGTSYVRILSVSWLQVKVTSNMARS
jgi:hypothetical protein